MGRVALDRLESDCEVKIDKIIQDVDGVSALCRAASGLVSSATGHPLHQALADLSSSLGDNMIGH